MDEEGGLTMATVSPRAREPAAAGDAAPRSPPPDAQTERLDALEREVPEELRDVPGIPRHAPTERFYAREEPLRNWQAMHAKFMQRKRQAHRHIVGPYKEVIERVRRRALASHRVAPAREPTACPDLTAAVRAKALELGFALVGFTANDRKYVYQECRKWSRFDTAIVAMVEIDHAATQKAPHADAERAGFDAQVRWSEAAFALADHLRERGYHAQVHSPFHPTEIVQHYAVAAGLGQMGANGQCLAPGFGSRCRFSLVTTDAPLAHDRPRDFGIPKLCDLCRVCVSRCPGQALTAERVVWRGVTKHKTVADRCAPILMMYDNCGICVKTCPVQKYGYEAVMRHYRETGWVLGKGSEDLEAYDLPDKGRFGPGQRPTFARETLIHLRPRPPRTTTSRK